MPIPTFFRGLRTSRGFVIAAALSIALAVGANAAIFSIVNALWFRPLPISHPEQIVVPYIPVVHSSDGAMLDYVAAGSRLAVESLDCFKGVTFQVSSGGLWGDWAPIVRLSDDAPGIRATAVAHDYFATLGVPVRGRQFSPDEDRWGSEPVAIVSERFGKLYLPAATEVVGTRLTTARGPILIVGVAQGGFHGARLGEDIDLWLPFGALGTFSDIASSVQLEPMMPVTIFARLADGVSVEAAQDRMRGVINRRATLRTLREIAFPLRSEGDLQRQSSLLRLLWTAAALMLMLGSANLAALLLMRTEARGHDMAVRLSLGAGSGRLARMVIVEALGLCAVGLIAGLFLRQWMLSTVAAMPLPSGVEIQALDLRLDWIVLLFSVVTALVSTGIAALSAVRRALRTDVSRLLASSAPATARTLRTRQVLLAAHVALSVVLLIGAATLVLSVQRAFTSDRGFSRDELLFVRVRPRLTQYMRQRDDDKSRRWRDYAALMERAAMLPDVAAVSYGAALMQARTGGVPLPVSVGPIQHELPLTFRSVGPGYLSAVGARFIQGRDLASGDAGRVVSPQDVMLAQVHAIRTGEPYRKPAGRPVAVVDKGLAQVLWPGENPIGKTFTRGGLGITYEVVGVVDSIRGDAGATRETNAFDFQPLGDDDGTMGFSLVIRAKGRGADLKPAITALVRQLFPDAALLQTRTVDDIVAEERAHERMAARMFSWFGLTSGALGMVGVYGLVAYVVARSRREFGIRAALGATHGHLTTLSTLRAIRPVVAGLTVGVAAALVLTRLFAARTAGITGVDGWAYLIAVGLFLVAALLASTLGAGGVRQVKPYEALRFE